MREVCPKQNNRLIFYWYFYYSVIVNIRANKLIIRPIVRKKMYDVDADAEKVNTLI
jgi:hypothetical protein